MRPEYNIDKGEFFDEQFCLPLLLRHTAAHRDEQSALLFFQLFERADIAESMILGIFPNAAGVEYDDIRILNGALAFIPCTTQKSRYLLRFMDVHLAAVSDDVIVHSDP